MASNLDSFSVSLLSTISSEVEVSASQIITMASKLAVAKIKFDAVESGANFTSRMERVCPVIVANGRQHDCFSVSALFILAVVSSLGALPVPASTCRQTLTHVLGQP